LSEFKYRHLWDKDVKRVEYDDSKINRVGTKHNCVLNLGSLTFETITTPSSNSLVYGEKTKDMIFTKNYTYLIELHKIDKNTTHIKLSLYLILTPIGALMKSNILKMVSKKWNVKLDQLHELSKNKFLL
jgi:hypothetical protein